MVIRNSKVHFKSKEQQHSFNFPHQLGTGSSSLPESADLYNLDLENGDLIVIGSDGLFDNVFEDEILECLQREGIQDDPQLMAQELALTASILAHQPNRLSPFAAAALRSNLYFEGGKVDDITVIVSRFIQVAQGSAQVY